MSKRWRDILTKAEAKYLPKPVVKGPSAFFIVKPTLAALDDWKGEEAKARAEAIAAGIILTPDARGVLGEFESHEQSEAWCMKQQAKLLADGQSELEALRNAQAQAAVGTHRPAPKAKPQLVSAIELARQAQY